MEDIFKSATIDDLPETLQNLVPYIGLENVFKVITEYGGTRIFVPRKVKEWHKLVYLLGFDSAKSLSDYTGGETLTIPKASNWIRKVRNLKIQEAYDSGLGNGGVRSLAREYDLTERQVYAVLTKSY